MWMGQQPGRNRGRKVVLLHNPWISPPQPPAIPGTRLGPGIVPWLGTINHVPQYFFAHTQVQTFATCFPPPPHLCIARVLSLATDQRQYMQTLTHTLSSQQKKEGGCWHKKQVIWSINQGSDVNMTEIERPKVTNIYYNTVAPFYIYKQSNN